MNLTTSVSSSNMFLPYGVPSNIHSQHLYTKGKIVEPKSVSTADRKCMMEAHLLFFIYKHNLPISMTPELVQICKDVSRDQKVLKEISIPASSAINKIIDCLGFFYNKADILSDCNWTRTQNSILAKWLSVRLRTRWFWVRVQLQSLKTSDFLTY